MSKVLNIAAGLAVVPMLAFSAPVFADSPGDLAGGSDIYQARNVTQNGGYGSAITTACGDVVKYSVKLSNTDYSKITDVTVKASLTSGDMNASATTANGGNTTTSGKVNVTLPTKGSLSYVGGSTVLYTVDGQFIKNLADGVTNGGVNAGDLNGSTREFLQFQAKVNCETTPPTTIKVCDLTTKKIVTINESDFNSTKYSKDLTKCEAVVTPPATTTTLAQPTTLVNTGAGDVAALFAVVATVATVAYSWVMRRQTSR